MRINKDVNIGDPSSWYRNYNLETYATDAAEDSYLASTDGTSFAITSTSFKSRYIRYWRDAGIGYVNRVRIRLCKDGSVQKTVIFDATSSTYDNWLAPSKITYDEWDDVSSSTSVNSNWYGISTNAWSGRDFCIHPTPSTCSDDTIWFCISTTSFCSSYGENGKTPGIFFAPGSTAYTTQQSYYNSGQSNIADVFLMEIEISAPTAQPSPTKPPTMAPTLSPSVAPTTPPTNAPTPICPNLRIDIIETNPPFDQTAFQGLYVFQHGVMSYGRPLWRVSNDKLIEWVNGAWIISAEPTQTLSYNTSAVYPPYNQQTSGWQHNRKSGQTYDVLIGCVGSFAPIAAPTLLPTEAPTYSPSLAPSISPSLAPSEHLSQPPSAAPSQSPTAQPSNTPSLAPTGAPSLLPSLAPVCVYMIDLTNDICSWSINLYMVDISSVIIFIGYSCSFGK